MSRAVVFGGTGQIGRAVAEALLDEGWSVTCAHNVAGAPPAIRGATLVGFERNDPASCRAALGEGCDLLVDVLAMDAAHALQLAELQAGFEALAVISSASVYCDAHGRAFDGGRGAAPDLPEGVGEDHGCVAPGDATYATRKRAMELGLLEQVRRPLTILRPGAVYGPGSRMPREWWVLKRLLDNQMRIPLAYGGRSRFHSASTRNLADLLVCAVRMGGVQVLNAADPEALSAADIVQAIGAVTAQSVKVVPFEGEPEGVVGASPWSVARPLVLDLGRAERIGYRARAGYGEMVRETCWDLLRRTRGGDWRMAFPKLSDWPADMFDPAEDAAWLARRSAA